MLLIFSGLNTTCDELAFNKCKLIITDFCADHYLGCNVILQATEKILRQNFGSNLSFTSFQYSSYFKYLAMPIAYSVFIAFVFIHKIIFPFSEQ